MKKKYSTTTYCPVCLKESGTLQMLFLNESGELHCDVHGFIQEYRKGGAGSFLELLKEETNPSLPEEPKVVEPERKEPEAIEPEPEETEEEGVELPTPEEEVVESPVDTQE